MRNTTTLVFFIGLLLIFDWYVFSVVRTLTANLSDRYRLIIHSVYLSISVLAVVLMIAMPLLPQLGSNRFLRNYIFAILLGLFLAKLTAACFFLIDDIRRLGTWVAMKAMNAGGMRHEEETTIQRSTFLSWLGVGFGTLLFSSLLLGFRNKYNYQVKRVKLSFPNLPDAFRGLKLVHISDIHSGSFQNKKAVAHGVDLINQQNADLILFTGDLVNDRADEMADYQSVFARLKAKYGVFSTLGNHDYGDYVAWENAAAKKANLQKLIGIHKAMGWRLLMNENVVLEKNGQHIALLGIENWGAKARFPKYGRLADAYRGTAQLPFKILMSHDPSHWDAQIRPEFPDIDLTLSGHTHGMQFGTQNPYFRFSPVQWVYKQWAGLYEEGRQKLYVNPGFGFIGYPGRVGILPEITVIELA